MTLCNQAAHAPSKNNKARKIYVRNRICEPIGLSLNAMFCSSGMYRMHAELGAILQIILEMLPCIAPLLLSLYLAFVDADCTHLRGS